MNLCQKIIYIYISFFQFVLLRIDLNNELMPDFSLYQIIEFLLVWFDP